MFNRRYYYLIKIQYLGYRFHGWQKQPKLKTLHLMVDRTLNYVLKGQTFKTLAAGRTDAMVSAQEAAFELFLDDYPLENEAQFLDEFNYNLPQDIRALSIEMVDKDFNIIQHPKIKEYNYLFTHGQKCHPFCAPLMTTILDELDIDLMIEGASLFKGKHNFRAYCYQANENSVFDREIVRSELVLNNEITASFFPEKSYLFKVSSDGFGRNQIRLMMGALIDLGKHKLSLEDIRESLKPDTEWVMEYIAPASGLILNRIEFE